MRKRARGYSCIKYTLGNHHQHHLAPNKHWCDYSAINLCMKQKNTYTHMCNTYSKNKERGGVGEGEPGRNQGCTEKVSSEQQNTTTNNNKKHQNDNNNRREERKKNNCIWTPICTTASNARAKFNGREKNRAESCRVCVCVCVCTKVTQSVYLAQVSSRKLINFNAIRHLYDFEYTIIRESARAGELRQPM